MPANPAGGVAAVVKPTQPTPAALHIAHKPAHTRTHTHSVSTLNSPNHSSCLASFVSTASPKSASLILAPLVLLASSRFSGCRGGEGAGRKGMEAWEEGGGGVGREEKCKVNQPSEGCEAQ